MILAASPKKGYVRLPKRGHGRPPLRNPGLLLDGDFIQRRKWAPTVVAAIGSTVVAALGSLMVPSWDWDARTAALTEQTDSIAQEASDSFAPGAALQLTAHGKRRLRIPSSAFKRPNTGALFTKKEYKQVTRILEELDIDITPDSAFVPTQPSDTNVRPRCLSFQDLSSFFSCRPRPESNSSNNGGCSPSKSPLWPGSAQPRRPSSENLAAGNAQSLHEAIDRVQKSLQRATRQHNPSFVLPATALECIATSFHVRCLAPIILRQILGALSPDATGKFSMKIQGALNQMHAYAYCWPFPLPSSSIALENEITAPQFPRSPLQMSPEQLINCLHYVTDRLYRSNYLLSSMLEMLQRRTGKDGAMGVAQLIRQSLKTDLEHYQPLLSRYTQQCNLHQLCALLEIDSKRGTLAVPSRFQSPSHSNASASNTLSPLFVREVGAERSVNRSERVPSRGHTISDDRGGFPETASPGEVQGTVQESFHIRGPRTVYNVVEGLADLTCSLVILDLLRFRKDARQVAEDQERNLVQSAKTNLWPITGTLKPATPTEKGFQNKIMDSSYAHQRLTGLYSRYALASEPLSEYQLIQRFRKLNAGFQMGLKTTVGHKLLCDRIRMCISGYSDQSVLKAAERILRYSQELEMTCAFLHRKLNEFTATVSKRVGISALHQPLAEFWLHAHPSAQSFPPDITSSRGTHAGIPALRQSSSTITEGYKAPQQSNTSGSSGAPPLSAFTQFPSEDHGAFLRVGAGGPSENNVAYVSVIQYARPQPSTESNIPSKPMGPQLRSVTQFNKIDKPILGATGRTEGKMDLAPYLTSPVAGCSYQPTPGPSYSNIGNSGTLALNPRLVASGSRPQKAKTAPPASSAVESTLERSNVALVHQRPKTWKKHQKRKHSSSKIP